MKLYERIESDMKAAMKDGDAVKLSSLRMLISSIRTFIIDNNVKEPEEPDILQILQRHIKQRRESIDQFEKGKRQDLADKEKKELKILEAYMPKQLTEEELTAIIKGVIAESGLSAAQDLGKVMKAVMEKVKGRSDGKLVNQIAASLLK